MVKMYHKYCMRPISLFLLLTMVISSCLILTNAPVAYADTGDIIVDNSDTGYTESGTNWKTSGLTDCYGTDSRYNDGTSTSAYAKWTPNIPESGIYNVYIWYPDYSTCTDAAPFTVYYDGGSKSYSINQKVFGGEWVLLGAHYFTAGTSGYVKLTSVGQGTSAIVRADAVKFEPLVQLPSFVVDNSDTGYAESGSGWQTSGLTGCYGSSSRYNSSTNMGQYATWTPNIQKAGRYKVYVWYPATSLSTDAAPFTVYYNGGSQTYSVNQKVNGGQWVLLGTHDFAAGTGGYVRLDNSGQGTERADAVKFEEAFPEGSLQILNVTPTVFYENAYSNPLKQTAKLQIYYHGPSVAAKVKIYVPGQSAYEENIGTIASDVSTVDIHVLDISSNCNITFELYRTGQANYDSSTVKGWAPQKKWKVYLPYHPHEDLGYESWNPEHVSQSNDYIDTVKAYIDNTQSYADESKFRYSFEHIWWLDRYTKDKAKSSVDDLMTNYIKSNDKIGVMNVPSGLHTHWMGYEQSARYAYMGKRELKDKYGLSNDQLDTTYQVDTPRGENWGLISILANSGIKYLDIDAGQPWRGEIGTYSTDGIRTLAYWLAPNGTDKILLNRHALPNSSYGIWYRYFMSDYNSLEKWMQQVFLLFQNGDMGPYPADAILGDITSDHAIPSMIPLQNVKTWNDKYTYPQLRLDQANNFFQYVEQNFGSQLEVVSGDYTAGNSDYAAIDASVMGNKREGENKIAAAQGLGVIGKVLDNTYNYSADKIRDAYNRMYEFDEHCWPTSPSVLDFHMYNTWEYKLNNASKVKNIADELLDSGLNAIKPNITTTGKSIVAFNPLAHERAADIISVKTSDLEYTYFDIVDSTTGMTVPYQNLTDGTTIFTAQNVPAFGYKIYRVNQRADAPVFSDNISSSGNIMENSYYRVTFDSVKGTITSIYDKQLAQELVDSASVDKLNQYIYVHTDTRTDSTLYKYSPSNATITSNVSGPVRGIMTTTTSEPNSGADIQQKVILYDNLKRIDIVNQLTDVDKLYGAKEDRYKDNIFYAFPFNVNNFNINVETAGAVTRPTFDQLAGSGHDFMNMNNWVDVSNNNYGITMYSREAITVHLGKIMYNQFSRTWTPDKPYVYSYAASNRMQGLNTRDIAEADQTINYSLYSHAGDWKAGDSSQFGWEKANPLEATIVNGSQSGILPATSYSFASVDKPNVQMVVMKQSEKPGKGITLRFYETEGVDTTGVKVSLPFFAPESANHTNIVEDIGYALPVTNNDVTFNITKNGWETIRVYSGGDAPAQVTGLSASTVNDKALSLSWTANSDADLAGYNIYRSTDSGFSPNAYNLIGFSSTNSFTDDWLDPATSYYYKVAAVDKKNNEGVISTEANAVTSSTNTSAPRPVQNLTAIEYTNSSIIVGWDSNTESDVSSYKIYRGTTAGFTPNDSTNLITNMAKLSYYKQYYTDTGLSANTKYYYKVLPVDIVGNVQSSSAVEVSATTSP